MVMSQWQAKCIYEVLAYCSGIADAESLLAPCILDGTDIDETDVEDAWERLQMIAGVPEDNRKSFF